MSDPTSIPFTQGQASKEEFQNAQKLFAEANAFCRLCAKRLTHGLATNDTVLINLSRHGLLKTWKSCFAAVVRANMSFRLGKRTTLYRCMAVANRMASDAPITDKVHVYAKAKSSGGSRVISIFGLHHRAEQIRVQMVLGASFRPRSFQFTLRGVGDAILTCKAAVNAGQLYAAEIDFQDFFGSFTFEKLASVLPLPKRIVEGAVTARRMKHAAQGARHPKGQQHTPSVSLLQQARLGIPQGSICSPIVSAYCVARLAWSETSHATLANYVDNFYLFASSKAELEKAIKELVSALTNLPGGTFTTAIKQKTHLSDGFVILGHRLYLQDGELQVGVSYKNEEAFCGTLNAIECRLDDLVFPPMRAQKRPITVKAEDVILHLAKFYSFGVAWVETFKLCDDVEDFGFLWAESLLKWVAAAGTSLEVIQTAVPFARAPKLSAYGLMS